MARPLVSPYNHFKLALHKALCDHLQESMLRPISGGGPCSSQVEIQVEIQIEAYASFKIMQEQAEVTERHDMLGIDIERPQIHFFGAIIVTSHAFEEEP